MHGAVSGLTRTQRWRGFWAAPLAYFALSLLLCWPLALRLFTHIPLGTLAEPTVPYFNLWTLQWNALQLQRGFAEYWNAPIFFPARDAFALSEPQGLTGLLFAPLAAAVGPLGGYNLTLLLLLTANGLAGRRLLREAGASTTLASWGGVLFVGMQFLREELGVLQLCATWPIVLSLSEIARLTRQPDPWAVIRLGLSIVATGWSCIYYLLFSVVLIALSAPFVLRRCWLERRMLSALLLGLVVVALGILPLIAAEQRAVASYTRSAQAIHSGSGSALAYLHFPRDTPLAKLVPSWTRPSDRRSLYPGALVCVLAVLGAVDHARRRERRALLWYSGAALALALFLSFGTRLHIAGFTPYELTAQRYLPGFDRLRSPYRCAAFVQILLALWAGLGLHVIAAWQRRARPQLWAANLALAGCVLLALFEVTPWHFDRAAFPHAALVEPWIAWLAHQPPGAVAMFPPNPTGRSKDYVDTTVYMLQGLRHGHPIVNGYSGFFPPASDRMVDAMRTFPSAQSLKALRDTGVHYAVAERTLDAVRQLNERPNPGFQPVFTSGPRVVYLVK